tara:strand:+ start:533 stop:703 length:171 start_codon:yes stop_codon:yes gene_type:complete
LRRIRLTTKEYTIVTITSIKFSTNSLDEPSIMPSVPPIAFSVKIPVAITPIIPPIP